MNVCVEGWRLESAWLESGVAWGALHPRERQMAKKTDIADLSR